MVAHIVLFEPRPDLSMEERREFLRALDRACREIPNVRRVRVGRRIAIGAKYESIAGDDYRFSAVFEFDDVEALRGYLSHPLHGPLGELFWRMCARTLIVDSEILDPHDGSLATAFPE